MIERKGWEEFRACGLLWWVNRVLHVFGWAIVFDVEADGKVNEVYPARVQFRGFTQEAEVEGHIALSEYVAKNAAELAREAMT